jgi:cell division protein ZapA (FtsZ GTPase activity inhibitor)
VAEKQSVTVTIRGREFRVRGTIDSLDVALLTALNLAREVVEMREVGGARGASPARLQGLIELAESALAGASPGS